MYCVCRHACQRVFLRTRLTIVASSPEGHEFTIRTPGTPDRWRQYDDELGAVWGKLTATVCENARLDCQSDGEGKPKDEEDRAEVICDLILEVRVQGPTLAKAVLEVSDAGNRGTP